VSCTNGRVSQAEGPISLNTGRGPRNRSYRGTQGLGGHGSLRSTGGWPGNSCCWWRNSAMALKLRVDHWVILAGGVRLLGDSNFELPGADPKLPGGVQGRSLAMTAPLPIARTLDLPNPHSINNATTWQTVTLQTQRTSFGELPPSGTLTSRCFTGWTA
jgi:hypothetical protein